MSNSDIERDIDFIIDKTKELATIVTQEQYHLLETKELIRQQLIQQFNDNYSAAEMANVEDKLVLLYQLSTEITQRCEDVLTQTKQNILKLKQANKVKQAYNKK